MSAERVKTLMDSVGSLSTKGLFLEAHEAMDEVLELVERLQFRERWIYTHRKAMVLEDEGRVEAAREWYEKAAVFACTDFGPQDPAAGAAKHFLAQFLVRCEAFEEALDITATQSDTAHNFFLRALCLEKLGAVADARDAVRDAIRTCEYPKHLKHYSEKLRELQCEMSETEGSLPK